MTPPQPLDPETGNGKSAGNIKRRTFLGVLFFAVAALCLRMTSLAYSFLRPPKKAGTFGSVINAGDISDLPQLDAAPVHVPRGRFWLVRGKDGVTALHSSCTHLECLFGWDDNKEVFVCPCHGSEFSRDGRVLNGPATRDLDRFPIQLVTGKQEIVRETPGLSRKPLAVDDLFAVETQTEPESGEAGDIQTISVLVDTSVKIPGTEQS